MGNRMGQRPLGQAMVGVGTADQQASQNEATHVQPSKYRPASLPAAEAMDTLVPERGTVFKTFLTF
jgi:hypothetical protein